MTSLSEESTAIRWQVRSEARLRESVGVLFDMASAKVKPQLDADSMRFVAASPYVCVATSDRDGNVDASPRGDEPGFVKMLDPTTIAIPDRPGNHIADTLTNLLENPGVGLLFLVPGCPETLRVNGRARIVDGPPELLEAMAARERTPKVAIIVDIEQVYMHCGRAAQRSRIWDPDMTWIDPRPDLLIGNFLGINEEDSRDLLAAYNTNEL
jgi:PPOX class probable FMN-dependent enzyme